MELNLSYSDELLLEWALSHKEYLQALHAGPALGAFKMPDYNWIRETENAQRRYFERTFSVDSFTAAQTAMLQPVTQRLIQSGGRWAPPQYDRSRLSRILPLYDLGIYRYAVRENRKIAGALQIDPHLRSLIKLTQG